MVIDGIVRSKRPLLKLEVCRTHDGGRLPSRSDWFIVDTGASWALTCGIGFAKKLLIDPNDSGVGLPADSQGVGGVRIRARCYEVEVRLFDAWQPTVLYVLEKGHDRLLGMPLLTNCCICLDRDIVQVSQRPQRSGLLVALRSWFGL